ncbi:MAG: helix-turn-helix transcriptional regulator [SAR324 cluster bacterium]|nr:helix-turn-helix transcriptional regulator [SAR324 cluster bacterium]
MLKSHPICSHLDAPVRIFYYRAPKNEWPIPRTIVPDLEEIELIVNGHVYFEYKGEEIKLSCGHIVWHLPGEKTVHKSDLNDPYECLVIKFPVGKGVSKRPSKVSFWGDPDGCRQFVDEILAASKQSQNRLLLRDYVYTRLFWQAMSGINQVHDSGQKGMRKKDRISSPVQRVKEHIHYGFHHPLSVKELCEVAELSESHLYLRFKREMGKTPHQYLLGRRMEEATHLLIHSELSVKVISYQCGFQDSTSFCRSFKSIFNSTPLQFRQRGEIKY